MAILNKVKKIFNDSEGNTLPQGGVAAKATKATDGGRVSKKVIRVAGAHSVIVAPHITEKASVSGNHNHYVFKIFSSANRIEVKKAVESLYKVKVANVNIVNVPQKTRRKGAHVGSRAGYKKAIVMLKSGYSIDLLPH